MLRNDVIRAKDRAKSRHSSSLELEYALCGNQRQRKGRCSIALCASNSTKKNGRESVCKKTRDLLAWTAMLLNYLPA